MSDVVRNEIQVAVELATGINKQRWMNVLVALDAEREANVKEIEAYRELMKRNDEAYLIMKETQDKEIADLRKQLSETKRIANETIIDLQNKLRESEYQVDNQASMLETFSRDNLDLQAKVDRLQVTGSCYTPEDDRQEQMVQEHLRNCNCFVYPNDSAEIPRLKATIQAQQQCAARVAQEHNRELHFLKEDLVNAKKTIVRLKRGK